MAPWVIETTEATFEQDVIERSRSHPVLVDFWAAWCGPCRILGPTIEAAVQGRKGQVWLAKVDVDAHQGLAAAFGIRGIPTVKAFVNGEMAGEFVGVRDRSGIEAFIDSLVPSDEEQTLGQAAVLFADGRYAEVITTVDPLLQNPRYRDSALLLVARSHAGAGDFLRARAALEEIPEGSPEQDAARSLALRIALIEAAGEHDESALTARVQADPDDPDARWALAGRLLAENKNEAALDQLLELVQRDRRYQDDGARRAMIAIFDGLGPDNELTHTYRRRLQVYV